MSNKELTIFNQENTITRDFIYVDDVVEGITKCLDFESKKFEIFNISTGKKTSLEELAKIIATTANKKIKKITYQKQKFQDISKFWSSNQKAQKMLGFKPKLNITQGIKKTIR